jgi:hypothetical protein
VSRWLLVGAFLLLTVGTGVTMILAAAGVVPVDDRDFGAPRWIVAAIGLVFVSMGLYVLLLPWAATEARRGLLGGAFALVFFTAASIFLTWAVLSGAEGRGGLRVAGLPIPLPPRWEHWLGRAFVAFCAVLMDTLTVIAWWAMGRHLWRSLARGRLAP